MFQRSRNYFVALAVLVTLALTYQSTLDPWLEPPIVKQIKLAELPALRGDDSLADLFPYGAWQRGACKRLQTKDGVLLYDRWEQTADDQWKLWPVTVVIGRGTSIASKNDPIVIESDEGAEIKFSGSLNMMSGSAPPIDRGRIIGKVRIRRAGPSSSGNSPSGDSSTSRARPSLDIRTAEVGIDSRKIWTTESIEMRLGDAHLIGRDLTLHLAAATGTTGGGSNPSDVLDRMELIYLDTLSMPFAQAPLVPPAQRKAMTQSNSSHHEPIALERPPAEVSVACGGRVEYDFALDRLSLRDQVSLVYKLANSEPDRFQCELLELALRDPMNGSLNRSGPLDWLLRVRAEGAPAVATLPSFGFELAAESIHLDAVGGLLSAEGSSGVRVRYGGINARLARLGYQFNPAAPEQIGAIDAFGSGLVEVDDPAIPLRLAQWRDGFKLQPRGAMTAQTIDSDVELWIDGDISAVLADGGKFHADKLWGILSPDKPPRTDLPPATRPSFHPDRFHAEGDVRLDTSAIAVQTSKLMLQFVADPPAQPQRLSGENSQPNNMRQWVSQPKMNADGTSAPVARDRPRISGDKITAQLRLVDGSVGAKDLQVSGNVQVTHNVLAGGTALEARLTGERLVMREGDGDDVLQLTSDPSRPARFELGDGYFVGPEIQVRPSENIVWINSAGEFRMPTAILPTGLTQTQPVPNNLSNPEQVAAPENKIRWTEPPLCRWQGQMIFDGHSAVLTDGVDISAALINADEPWKIRLKGDRLEVFLDADVRVRDVQTIRKAAVQKVVLMQSTQRPVVVEAYQYDVNDVLITRHLMSAPQLSFMPMAGGKLLGDGPGWYRAWMLAKNATGEPTLRGIHLDYYESMQADVSVKSLEFIRGVRVATKFVNRWDEIVDASAMVQLSMDESTMDCDQLRFAVDPRFVAVPPRGIKQPTPWEMEASGGVVFKTRNERGMFDGTAQRAAYSSSKGVFTVEDGANRPAVFRQTQPNGQAGPELAVKTMTILPETMEIQNMVLERFNFGMLPGNENR